VQPENLADLVRGEAFFATLTSQASAIRSDIRDNAIEPLRILTVKGHGKELTDVHIEHITLLVNDALM
jgi:DNA-binding winged helix-turn-helix (wHTH) protein